MVGTDLLIAAYPCWGDQGQMWAWVVHCTCLLMGQWFPGLVSVTHNAEYGNHPCDQQGRLRAPRGLLTSCAKIRKQLLCDLLGNGTRMCRSGTKCHATLSQDESIHGNEKRGTLSTRSPHPILLGERVSQTIAGRRSYARRQRAGRLHCHILVPTCPKSGPSGADPAVSRGDENRNPNSRRGTSNSCGTFAGRAGREWVRGRTR
jgi:hypothetical protein